MHDALDECKRRGRLLATNESLWTIKMSRVGQTVRLDEIPRYLTGSNAIWY